jgi:hypothetical protein
MQQAQVLNRYHMAVVQADGRQLVFINGIAQFGGVMSPPYTNVTDQIQIVLPGQWARVDEGVVSAGFAGFGAVADHPLWRIDDAYFSNAPAPPRVVVDVHMYWPASVHRLTFTAVLIGVGWQPPVDPVVGERHQVPQAPEPVVPEDAAGDQGAE